MAESEGMPPARKRRRLNDGSKKPVHKNLEKCMNDLRRRSQRKSTYNRELLITGPSRCSLGGGSTSTGSSFSGVSSRDRVCYGVSSSSSSSASKHVKTADEKETDKFFAGLMSPAQQKLRNSAYESFMSARTNTTDSAELPGEENDCTAMVVADAVRPVAHSKTILLTASHGCTPKCTYMPVRRNACSDYYTKKDIMVEDLRNGHVYSCTQSGCLHVCTYDKCDAQGPADGFPTCWKTGRVFESPILVPSKSYFEDNPLPTRVQLAISDEVARGQCMVGKARVSAVTTKRKRSTEDPRQRKVEQATQIVRVLIFTIPDRANAEAGSRKKLSDDVIVQYYVRIIMDMWDFSLRSPHNTERERTGGQSRAKAKRDSLTMRFAQFVFAGLYRMKIGFQIKPNITQAMLQRANGLSEHLTQEFIDSHTVCFLLRDEYLNKQLVAENQLPQTNTKVNGVLIDRRYISTGFKLMRMCFCSYIHRATEELISSQLAAADAINEFEQKLAELPTPMNQGDDM